MSAPVRFHGPHQNRPMTVPEVTQDSAIDALRAAIGSHYEVIRRVGMGGMGSVYLARDLTLDREVAVKVINPDVAANSGLRERFLQEARTVARLRHPGIVSVYAAGEIDGMLYFVMEYVPGESLRDMLTREGKLDAELGTRILKEIALALDDAHGHGLVHRDVKPENILIDRTSGHAMLTDFGVARALEKDGGMTVSGMILGSPRYMSPEQASGDRPIDGRSDLYSLALAGYEVFTGAAVMQANSVAAILVKQLTETPVPLGEKLANLPSHIAEAIDRGLAKEPVERWQTGRDFASALAGGELTPSGERAGATQAGLRVVKPAKKRKIPIAAKIGGLVAVFASLLAVVISGGRKRGGDLNSYIVAPFEIQSGDPTVTWLREGSANMLTLALNQWTDLRVVDYERTLSLLDDENLGNKARLSLDDALELARHAEAGVVVTGQVQTTSDSLRVIARLYNVSNGSVMEQAQEAGALSADPRPLFDRLARTLLQIKGGPNAAMELTAATTTSIAAYRAYLDGVRLLNTWRLQEADSAFGAAIARDSTFALAYHKKSLTLGWSDVGGVNYLRASEHAKALSSRLPARERALVEGHYHLVQGLVAGNNGKPVESMAAYDTAIAVYRSLTARDSLVPEAWYGLADAYFHGRSMDNPAQSTKRVSLSIAGFNRTLAIDSSFHLAYSHLVQLYNSGSVVGSGFVINADTAVLVQTPAEIARIGGEATVARLRAAAATKGIQIARAWVHTDEGAAQPILQLAQSFISTGAYDSALAVLHDAKDNPLAESKIAAMMIPFQMVSADTALPHDVPALLDRFTPDSMRMLSSSERMKVSWSFLAAAAMTGNTADVDRAAKLAVATDPVLAPSAVKTEPLIRWNQTVLNVAMGAPVTPEVRRTLAVGVRAIDALDNKYGMQGRNMSLSGAYLSYLATHDPLYRSMLGKWTDGRMDTTLTELDALAALDKGDTATARRIASTFPLPDSLRKARFGLGGMRSVARADVLNRLGLVRQAAESYEATSPVRFNETAWAEPGYALWVRALHDRARLWVQLGERDKAITTYMEFISRWRNADGAAAEQVKQARRELNVLTDGAVTARR